MANNDEYIGLTEARVILRGWAKEKLIDYCAEKYMSEHNANVRAKQVKQVRKVQKPTLVKAQSRTANQPVTARASATHGTKHDVKLKVKAGGSTLDISFLDFEAPNFSGKPYRRGTLNRDLSRSDIEWIIDQYEAQINGHMKSQVDYREALRVIDASTTAQSLGEAYVGVFG